MEGFLLSGPYSSMDLQVHRESLTKPWGFRLQGGADKGSPLFIQRVFSGSPAEGVLQRGDIIRKLDNLEGDMLEHKTAQDMVRVAGHQLGFKVDRYERKPTWSTACSKQHDHHHRETHSTQTHRSSSTIRQKTPSITQTSQNFSNFDNFGPRRLHSVPNSPRNYSRWEQNQNYIAQQDVFLHKPQNSNFSGGPMNGTSSTAYYGTQNHYQQHQTPPRVNRTLSNPVIAHSVYLPQSAQQNFWSAQSPSYYSNQGSNSAWAPISNGAAHQQQQNVQQYYQHQQNVSYNAAPQQRTRTVSASMMNINSHAQPARDWTVISNQPGRKRYSQQVSVTVGGNTHSTSQWDNQPPLRSSDQFGSTLSLDRGISIMRSNQSPQMSSPGNFNSPSQQKSGFFYSNIPKTQHHSIVSNVTTLKSFTNNLPSQPQTYDSLKLMKPTNRSALKQKTADQTFQISPNLKTNTPMGFQKNVAFDVRLSSQNIDRINQNHDHITEF